MNTRTALIPALLAFALSGCECAFWEDCPECEGGQYLMERLSAEDLYTELPHNVKMLIQVRAVTSEVTELMPQTRN